MKEYCIYIQNGSGLPFILSPYKNIHEAKIALENIISLEVERRRVYFVDNDFYNNKYGLVSNAKYLCIKERDVTDWVKYTEENILTNNIRFFSNYKK